ncbi:lipocalin family protein [Flavobacterium sp. CBA20B-1]|uniref:lipocalin family protein n=1 Tax=unclassified Flavobacterium TaxID=196869 RepID=UPI0022258A69|nr:MULTISPECIES: lipocalin family protein [unclassified Flavobacterium]WCM41947.1 lipocalin family protein [Flavobacterium sp. CBA20B-1]
MNRFFYIFTIAFSLIFLSSCSNDDSSPVIDDEPKEYLLGKWDFNAFDIKMSIDGEMVYEEEDIPDGGVQYHFKEDGVIEYRFFDSDTGEDEEVGSGTYQKTEDELTINRDGIPYSFTISNLNETNLHLAVSENGMDEQGRYVELELTQKFIKVE